MPTTIADGCLLCICLLSVRSLSTSLTPKHRQKYGVLWNQLRRTVSERCSAYPEPAISGHACRWNLVRFPELGLACSKRSSQLSQNFITSAPQAGGPDAPEGPSGAGPADRQHRRHGRGRHRRALHAPRCAGLDARSHILYLPGVPRGLAIRNDRSLQTTLAGFSGHDKSHLHAGAVSHADDVHVRLQGWAICWASTRTVSPGTPTCPACSLLGQSCAACAS